MAALVATRVSSFESCCFAVVSPSALSALGFFSVLLMACLCRLSRRGSPRSVCVRVFVAGEKEAEGRGREGGTGMKEMEGGMERKNRKKGVREFFLRL